MSHETCRLGQGQGRGQGGGGGHTQAMERKVRGMEPEVRSPLQGQVLSLTRDSGKGFPGEVNRIRILLL